MTVKELQDILATYPEDQFVHVRVWFKDAENRREINEDVVVEKVQQGSDGAALITCAVDL